MVNVAEPQVWVLIGLFAAVMFALLRFVTQSITKILRTEFGRMGDRFDEVYRRFADMDRRFDGLDRDVQAISAQIFPSTGDPRSD